MPSPLSDGAHMLIHIIFCALIPQPPHHAPCQTVNSMFMVREEVVKEHVVVACRGKTLSLLVSLG